MRRRLRAERERRGLSLRKLAAEVGISPSALSQIETGKSRPSVSTLYAIVTALELSLDGLFPPRDRGPGDPPAEQAVAAAPPSLLEPFILRSADRSAIDFTSGVHWERLSAPGDSVELLWITYQPGSASGEDFMRHSGREYGVVISGRLGVSIGFESYELDAGDAISFQSSAPHHLGAIGDAPAVAVWVMLEA